MLSNLHLSEWCYISFVRHQLEILPFRTHSHQAASRQQQCPEDTGTQVTTLSHGGPCGIGFTAANAEFKGVMKNQYLLSQSVICND